MSNDFYLVGERRGRTDSQVYRLLFMLFTLHIFADNTYIAMSRTRPPRGLTSRLLCSVTRICVAIKPDPRVVRTPV